MKKFLSALLVTVMATTAITGTVMAAENKKIDRIMWEHSGHLEPQKGYDKNIGTAGVLSGKLGEYIIVGGGANFPGETVLNGGAKKTYPDIYLLKQEKNQLKVVEHTVLDNEIGYGSSVTTKEGVYYIGGSPFEDAGNDILLFTLENSNKIKSEKIGELPFTISDGIASEKDGKLYIGLGKQDGKASNKFYEFDLKKGETKELAEIPGEITRNQAVAQILNGNLYVFSGGDTVVYTDGYQYDISKDEWSKVSNVKADGEEISLYGANSVKLNESEMLVIGGFNKEVYDNAVSNLNSLKDEKLAEFRAGYFGADPYEFNWNTKVLIYNANNDTWRSAGEIPFNAPCGQGLVLAGDVIYSINGEIKPGIRTNSMYAGTIIYK